MKAKAERGFTLLELMLAVAIIGILASVALPAYQDYTTRSKVAEGLQLVPAVQKAISEYRDRWGTLPASNAAAGLPAPTVMRGSWVTAIEVRRDGIVVRYAAELTSALAGSAVLFLRPAASASEPTGALVWICHQGKPPPGFTVPPLDPSLPLLPPKYLPGSCR